MHGNVLIVQLEVLYLDMVFSGHFPWIGQGQVIWQTKLAKIKFNSNYLI